MPKIWLYFIAVALPLLLRALLLDIGVVEWFWYQGHENTYYFLRDLRINPSFLEYCGGWPLPVFLFTVIAYWTADFDEIAIPHQFWLLPIAYVPFSVFGTMLVNREFDASLLYLHPLVLIPSGYLYILPWVIFIWVFEKLRLVI